MCSSDLDVQPDDPPAPPASAVAAADLDDLFRTFVRERDVKCPAPGCGYNLRNLTQPCCPECHQDLRIGVHSVHRPLGLFLATLVPGCFAGLAGLFLVIMMLKEPGAPIGAVLLTAFWLASGFVTLMLMIRHNWFIGQTEVAQVIWAFATWSIHLIVFLIVICNIP